MNCKNNLFEIILSRVCKEHRCFNSLKKFYNKKKTMAVVDSYIHNSNYVELKNTVYYSYWLHNTIFSFGSSIRNEIEKIIYDIVKQNIKRFCYENDIYIKVNSYLSNKEITIYEAKDLFDLIDKLNLKNKSPFSLIQYLFDWSKTKEGGIFWLNINRKYQKFLLLLLFNDYGK